MYFRLRKLKPEDKRYEVLAKYNYYLENFSNSKNDMKKTWGLINEALGKHTTKSNFSEYLISPSGNAINYDS